MTDDEQRSDVPPAAGPNRTDDDLYRELPPLGATKPDDGPRGDVDRQEPYEELSDALRLDDLDDV